MPETLDTRLSFALETARQAGALIIEHRQSATLQHCLKNGVELVTQTDIAVDSLIRSCVQAAYPGEAILSEELSPAPDDWMADALWVVDPVDGTVNFSRGLDRVAVSIAWVEQGVGKVGVVHAPFCQETFFAAQGTGAYCNDRSIRPSDISQLAQALVATGFPHDRRQRPRLIEPMRRILVNCQDIRRLGAGSLDICDVACGRLDAYYESVSPWDSAAGVVIAREAGARISHLSPPPAHIPADLFSTGLVVTSEPIHQDFKHLLLDTPPKSP